MPKTTPGFATTISIAKQTAQGTQNLPSSANYSANTGYSLRWLQGSKVRPHADFRQEQEGDGSRAESLNYKTGQWATGKTIFYARPKDAAMVLAAFSGSGSDSGTTTHVIRPTTTSELSDYYTLLMTVAKSTRTVRYIGYDAVCTRFVMSSGSQNPPLKIDADWTGGVNVLGSGAFTPDLPTEKPFFWFDANWTLSSALRGANADWQAVVRDLTLTFENALAPADFIAESINPLPMTVGNLRVTGDVTLLWQDGGIDAATYFGGGTADSPVVAQGDLSVTFACGSDPSQTLTVDLPAASWTMADFDPDLSGKPVEQRASLSGLRGSGGYPYSFSVVNSVSLAY